MKRKSIPNRLTIIRVLMVPLFVFLYLDSHLVPEPWNQYAALAVFAIASFTDYLDGYLARKWNLVSNFGKFMEQIRDFASDRIYDSDFAVELYSDGEKLSTDKLLNLYKEFLKTGSRNIEKLKSGIAKKEKAKRQKRKVGKRKRRR